MTLQDLKDFITQSEAEGAKPDTPVYWYDGHKEGPEHDQPPEGELLHGARATFLNETKPFITLDYAPRV